MDLYWVVISVVNMAVGVVAGWYLRGGTALALPPLPRLDRTSEHPEVFPANESKQHAPETGSPDSPVSAEGSSDEPVSPTPVSADSSVLGELAQLFQQAQGPDDLVLCAVFVLNKRSGEYLRELLKIEKQARRLVENPDPQAIRQCLDQLERINTQWLAVQQAALSQLDQNPHAQGASGPESLEHLIQQQVSQVETATNNLKMSQETDDPNLVAKQLLREVLALADQTHRMLHQAQHISAQNASGNLSENTPGQLVEDPLTNLPSLLGLHRLVQQWKQADQHGMRQASVVLIDVDGMQKINEELGVEMGDRLLATLGRALPQTIRKNRGFDRVGRYGGDRFLLFLGDASPHNASVVAERVRQSVENAQFLTAQGPLRVTVSCGVAEMLPGDSFEDTCIRVEATLRSAKQQGRNCTMVHDGTNISPVQAPPLKIPNWTFSLEEQTVAPQT